MSKKDEIADKIAEIVKEVERELPPGRARTQTIRKLDEAEEDVRGLDGREE